MTTNEKQWTVERVQTGVRMEKRLLKVLKALAELHDLSLGDLLEGIVLHAFDGKAPFSDDTRRRIAELKGIYGLDLDATASHRLVEVAAKRTREGTHKARDRAGSRATREAAPKAGRGRSRGASR